MKCNYSLFFQDIKIKTVMTLEYPQSTRPMGGTRILAPNTRTRGGKKLSVKNDPGDVYIGQGINTILDYP